MTEFRSTETPDVRAEPLAGQDREDPGPGSWSRAFTARHWGRATAPSHLSPPPREKGSPACKRKGLDWIDSREEYVSDQHTRGPGRHSRKEQRRAAIASRAPPLPRQGGHPRRPREGEGTPGVTGWALHLSPHRAAWRREGCSRDPRTHLSALDSQGEAGEPSEAQRTVGGGLLAGRMPHDQSPGACLGVCHTGACMS